MGSARSPGLGVEAEWVHGRQLWPIDHAGISLALSRVPHALTPGQTETYPYFLPSPGEEEADQGPGSVLWLLYL